MKGNNKWLKQKHSPKQKKDQYDAAQGRVTEENRSLGEQLKEISSPQDPQYAQIQGQIAANNKWSQ